MGWDIYFFAIGNEVTKEEILKNKKYKEKINKEDDGYSFIYITYIDDEGNERKSGLYMTSSCKELSYGWVNYGINVRPFCTELYHDFGLLSAEESIEYFDEDILPYENQLTEDEVDLIWQYRVIFEAYSLGIIDEPNDWIKERFAQLPLYMDIIREHKMDLSNANVLCPSYDIMQEHDKNLDDTYESRMKEKRRNRIKSRINSFKRKIKKWFTKKDDDLPF